MPNPGPSVPVANKAKAVEAVMPKGARPLGFSDGAWAFPERLAKLANRKGWFVNDIVEIAKVQQSTIWKWLHYQSAKPNPAAVRKIELKAGVPVGSLLQDPADGINPPANAVTSQLEEWADRVGLDESVVGVLTNDQLAAELKRFNRQLRGAILGIVHVYRIPLPRAIAIADDVRKARLSMVKSEHGTELYWFTEMSGPAAAWKKASGEFPSQSNLKVVE